MNDPASTTRNRILASLPSEQLDRLRIDAEDLRLKQVLVDVNKPIEKVYFPEDSVVSILGVMSDGTAIETATVGREGMIGIPLFLGTDQTSSQAFCQVPGRAFSMTADAFRSALRESPEFVAILQRYTQALFVLVQQGAACNRVHSMPQRCARWLLHTHDRIGRDQFPLTHQFIAQMLGVRRATVTDAMSSLARSHAIAYDMGVITIRNREKLEAEACECYLTITREFDRLLGTKWAPSPSPLSHLRTSENEISLLESAHPDEEASMGD